MKQNYRDTNAALVKDLFYMIRTRSSQKFFAFFLIACLYSFGNNNLKKDEGYMWEKTWETNSVHMHYLYQLLAPGLKKKSRGHTDLQLSALVFVLSSGSCNAPSIWRQVNDLNMHQWHKHANLQVYSITSHKLQHASTSCGEA